MSNSAKFLALAAAFDQEVVVVGIKKLPIYQVAFSAAVDDLSHVETHKSRRYTVWDVVLGD